MNFKFMHIFVEDSLKGCLFFCQSILAKNAKTPGFPRKNGKPGAFGIFADVRYCAASIGISRMSFWARGENYGCG
jgi:hypothetical protein